MAMKAMRSRLMAYTRGMPGGPRLRDRLARVESLTSSKTLRPSISALWPTERFSIPTASPSMSSVARAEALRTEKAECPTFATAVPDVIVNSYVILT